MPFVVQIMTQKVRKWTACAARFPNSEEAERHKESLLKNHTMITEARVEPTKFAANARWLVRKGLTWDE